MSAVAVWWEAEASSRKAYALAAALGLVAFCVVCGPTFALGTSRYWDMPTQDHRAYMIGYRYFLAEPWHWPVFTTHTMSVPFVKSIAFTDSIPIWALLHKAIGTVIPPWDAVSARAFLGLWYVTVFVLQACLGVAILRQLGQRTWGAAVATAVVFLALPEWSFRFHHASLDAQWLILWALLMYLRTPRRRAGAAPAPDHPGRAPRAVLADQPVPRRGVARPVRRVAAPVARVPRARRVDPARDREHRRVAVVRGLLRRRREAQDVRVRRGEHERPVAVPAAVQRAGRRAAVARRQRLPVRGARVPRRRPAGAARAVPAAPALGGRDDPPPPVPVRVRRCAVAVRAVEPHLRRVALAARVQVPAPAALDHLPVPLPRTVRVAADVPGGDRRPALGADPVPHRLDPRDRARGAGAPARGRLGALEAATRGDARRRPHDHEHGGVAAVRRGAHVRLRDADRGLRARRAGRDRADLDRDRVPRVGAHAADQRRVQRAPHARLRARSRDLAGGADAGRPLRVPVGRRVAVPRADGARRELCRDPVGPRVLGEPGGDRGADPRRRRHAAARAALARVRPGARLQGRRRGPPPRGRVVVPRGRRAVELRSDRDGGTPAPRAILRPAWRCTCGRRR